MRQSGILLPVSALPGPCGIGTFGAQAYRFVDFLVQAGQSCWQILPICPTSYGDSPYQSFSTFAGNPYFIDLELLERDGLLEPGEYERADWGGDPDRIDYARLYQNRFSVLRMAYHRFFADEPEEYRAFSARNADWLEDYALFMALKDNHGGAPWFQWEEPLKRRESGALEEARWRLREDIAFHKMLQYLFFRQWKLLKQYANDKDIRIIGDLPIYVAMDSADVWASPELFRLDEHLNPVEVAGCPPDGFTEDGQLWGNPIYDWDRMKQDGYAWWIRRIDAARGMYDTVRIDHFRGFDSYYCIAAGDTTAKNGQWRHGVGIEFFLVLEEALGKLSIIAEDLGYLTPSVRKLLEDTGYPGMKVLQFAFDSREDSDYLPHNYSPHCVVYTGTHDNDTILGWMEHAPAEDVAFAKRYLRLNEQEGYHWGMLKSAWASVGETVIVQMQDLLGLGSGARMNTPSILGGNWMWRMREEQMDSALAARLHELMALYRRLPQ